MSLKEFISANNFKRADQSSKDLHMKSKKQNPINQKTVLPTTKTNPVTESNFQNSKMDAASQE